MCYSERKKSFVLDLLMTSANKCDKYIEADIKANYDFFPKK